MLASRCARAFLHLSWIGHYSTNHSSSDMCSLCCVRTQTSSIGSGCSNSDTWYFIDSSNAYWMLVSYSIILQFARARIQFRKRAITFRSAIGTTSFRFSVKPPKPFCSPSLTVADIHINPLLPRMMLAPHGRLWKWVLRRFTKEGNTFTKTPWHS